jgi:hypothetical protein
LNRLKALWQNQDGVSAVELALIAPILIVAFYAAVEFNRYMMFQRRGEMATVFAAEYLSRDDNNVLTASEDLVWQDIWMIVNPDAIKQEAVRYDQDGQEQAVGYSRWATSVDFERDPACTDQPCDYLPSPIWSMGFQETDTGELGRDCELRIVSDSSPHAQDTLREGEVGRSPIVIVDMKFHYIPVISNPLFPRQDMDFTAIRSMRSGQPLVTDPDRTVWESAQCPS